VKTIPATELRANFFDTLKRVGYEREPIVIERRGRAIAALVPPQLVERLAASGARAPQTLRPTFDPKALSDFCAKHNVKTLYVFGSILTDHFDETSDVDVMFESDGPSPSFFEQMNMADELEALFGRKVDLVAKNAVEALPNQLRRRSILETARIVHGR
jgi:prevent-host-death family protein